VEEDSDDSDESDREIGVNYSSQTLTKKPQIQQSFLREESLQWISPHQVVLLRAHRPHIMRKAMKNLVKEKVRNRTKKNSLENKGFRGLDILNLIPQMREVGDKEEEAKEGSMIQIGLNLRDLLKKKSI
jgi:hypothetical protein